MNNIAFSSGSVHQIPKLYLVQLKKLLWQNIYPKIGTTFKNSNYILGLENLDQKQTENGIMLRLRIHVTIKNQAPVSTLQSDQAQILEELSTTVENFMERITKEKPLVFEGAEVMVWFAKSPQLGAEVAEDLIWNAEPFLNLTKSSKNKLALLQIERPQPGDRKRKPAENDRSDSNSEEKKAKISGSPPDSEGPVPTVLRVQSSPLMFRLPSPPPEEPSQQQIGGKNSIG